MDDNQDEKNESEDVVNDKNVENSHSDRLLKEEEVDIIKYQKSNETEKMTKKLEDLQ